MNLLRARDLLTTLPAAVIWAGALVALALIGLVDFWTSFELSMSIFYLLPVSAIAWGQGRRAGVAMSLIAAMVWLSSDLLEGHSYSSELIPFWNAAVRLGFFLAVSTLLASLHDELRRERRRADHDGLTGLLSAAAFEGRAEGILGLLERQCRPGALGFIDLDGFKQVNDILGHAAGDRLLVEVGDCIRRATRQVDLVGRFGGDEFVVLLADTSADGAREVFGRIWAGLDRVATGLGPGGRVGFSAGVVCFDGPVELRRLLRASDELMYRAKRGGRGRVLVEFWRVGAPAEASER